MIDLEFNLDFRSKLSLSRQVEQAIETHITAGALLPGDQLPTVRVLAQRLNVNFNTIARAYRSLDAAGFIFTRQGRGTYVHAQPPQDGVALEVDRRQLARELAQGAIQRAGSLGITAHELAQAMKAAAAESAGTALTPRNLPRTPARKKRLRTVNEGIGPSTQRPAGNRRRKLGRKTARR